MQEVKGLDEIRGQQEVAGYLKRDLKTGDFNHAYMFLGKRGIGKKAMALAFAKSILCQDGKKGFCGVCSSCRRFDKETYSEFLPFFDDGKSLKIEQVRKIIEEEHLKKYEGLYRIIFIEHAQRMTADASNALLKVLEEPLPGTIFIFTATNQEEILPTILSRVEKYHMNRLKEDDLKAVMEELGYYDVPYLSLGTIDETRVLLDYKDEDLMDYKKFKEFFKDKDLDALFDLAEKLQKKPYLKELLSYYELEAMASFKANLRSGDHDAKLDRRIIVATDNALRKIKMYINEKHSLEYCFLTIGGIFSEQTI